MSILWPLDKVSVTGEWANSPDFYAQFGQRGHNGIDLAANVGTPVFATDAGVVVAEGWGSGNAWMGSIAGIYVLLRHSWGYSAYAHLSSTRVSVGQKIARGQQIANSGATGVGTGPHLHFETFPLSPNFGNGYAGRVNPRAWGLVARGSTAPASPKPNAAKSVAKAHIIHRKRRRTSMLIYVHHEGKSLWAIYEHGKKGTWWEFTGKQSQANQLANQLGSAMTLSPSTWEERKQAHS